MKKFVFELQRFADISAFDMLQTIFNFIERFNLKNIGDTLAKDMSTIKTTKDFTAWLKKKINPFIADVGMIFYNKTIGKKLKVEDLTTLITKSISLFDNALGFVEEIKKPKAERSSTVIETKIGGIVSDVSALAKPLAKLGDKDLWFLSIVSAGVGLISNVIATTDGIDDDEKAKVNESFSLLMKSVTSEVAKKLFSVPTNQILATPASELVKKVTLSGGALDLIFSFVTGITNGIDKHKSSLEKYTADGIPEKIAKHGAIVDAIATIIHDTLSSFIKGGDDVVFAFLQKVLRDEATIDENKTYIDAIADIFKTLNPKNSGTSGDDKFYVLENKSMVYGESGNDDIGNYGFSNVTIWGGHDDDTLGSYKTDSATPQKNSIFGGPGDDQISVYDVNSTIYGGTGKDFINVVGTKNKIFGDADDDKLYIANGANNNTISGGTGNDFVVMQDATENTVIKYSSGDGNDTIYGFNEDDSIKISDSYKASVIDADVKITVGNGSILLIGMAGKNININDKTIKRGDEDSTVEPVPPPEFPTLPATVASPFIYGTEGDDTIKNTLDNVAIKALGGSDKIYNGGHWYGNYFDGGSKVTISGGNDNDRILISGIGSDKSSVNGDAGNDEIYNGGYWYEGINYTRHSGGSKVTISGGTGNDTLYNGGKDAGNTYGANEVSISGGNGDDRIYNHGLEATISCGDGNDYVFNGDGGYADKTSISGGDGNDSIVNWDDKVTINGDAGNDSIENYGENVLFKYSLSDGNDTIYGFRTDSTLSIDGGSYSTTKRGNDIIVTVGDGKITLVGAANLSIVHIEGIKDNSSGSKLVTITEGNDNYSNTVEGATINALGGNDSIHNSGNSSSIDGGSGNDLITTEYGNNVTITGGGGNDSIYNNGNSASIDGGSGNDLITTEQGNNVTISGGDGKDTLFGGTSNDQLLGNAGDDLLGGGDGKDTLSGGSGNDELWGDAGNDCIKGGTGEDTIVGGKGNDSLWGDDGADKFFYSKGDGKDIIYGFDSKDTLTFDNLAFTASYSKSKGTITFKVDDGSVILKDFTATTFHINNDTYKISGSTLKKQ